MRRRPRDVVTAQVVGAVADGPLTRRQACDHEPTGFQWLDADDRDHSVYAYLRRDGGRSVVVLLNLTPVPRPGYQAGAPAEGRWSLLLSSDAPQYGGSGYGLVEDVRAEAIPWQHQPASLRVDLPPLGAVVLAHEPD